MKTSKSSLLSKLYPSTLFTRVFWSIFIVAVLTSFFTWYWLYIRVYKVLDAEAKNKLKFLAQSLVSVVKSDGIDNLAKIDGKSNFISRSISLTNSSGWIQNAYLLDMRQIKPHFVASYSNNLVSKTTMSPPTADGAEDLVFDYINKLEKGNPIFPDPNDYGIPRRFKIIFVPILDDDGMLESVIGIEADMEYLRLLVKLRRYLVGILVFSVILSFIIGLLLANSVKNKVARLLKNIEKVEAGTIPDKEDLKISELTALNSRISDMATQIELKNAELKSIYDKKLEELAFTGAAIAHEIRNPLSAIEMHFGLIKRHLQKTKTDEHDSLEEVFNQLKHLKLLVENFLAYSRKVNPDKEKILLKDFIEDFLSQKQCMNIDFSSELEIQSELSINFDKTMLLQIIENLFMNSVEACKTNLIFKVSAAKDNAKVVIKVYDNGPGISEKIMSHIFTPFNTEKKGGNGIGLALVRKLVEVHKGKIYCSNIENGGVVFTIELPVN